MQNGFLQLVSNLQTELEEYGALLYLFDLQQACALRHDPTGYLGYLPQLEEQISRLARYRLSREGLVRSMAIEAGHPEDVTLRALAPDCPEPRRPLLVALIEEINNLTLRIRRRMRQNTDLLSRCVDVAREIVTAVDGEALPGTYSPRGRISSRISPARFNPTLA